MSIIMDRVVDWVGSAAISMVVEKVASYLSKDDELKPDMRTELQRLESELCHFKSALMVAEKQKSKLRVGVGSNSPLERWTWELRDASEEAEDVVDEMEYYQLEKQVTANRAADNKVCASSSGSTKKRKYFETIREKLWPSNDPMLDKLRDAIRKLDAVKINAKGVADIFSVTTVLTGDSIAPKNYCNTNNRETGHMLADNTVLGRDEDLKKMLAWLMNANGSQKISALTICGMGGLGKTTLCQAIYHDKTVKDHFDLRIWICVSNHSDVTNLLRRAIESAINGSAPATNNLSVLQQNLLDNVNGKKFLVVLDDVWDDADQTSIWEKFITPLKHGDRSSKILITTRQASIGQKIANVLLTEEKMQNLNKLSDADSVSLFNKHAFAGVNPNDYEDLQKIGNKIVKKCDGLPLFVKLIARLLGSNLNYSYWEGIWEKHILNSDELMSEGFGVLKISYQHLPPNLQACFRICSIFPQDYRFKRDELVNMWIGAGLIQPYRNDNKQVEEIGDEYLNSLQTRCFFELLHEIDEFDDTKYYVMHDLLHDLARDVSEGECLAVTGDKLINIPKTLRHISIRQPNNDIIKQLSNLQKLRTLYIYCNEPSTIVNKLLDDALMQLKSLRIISLRNVHEFNSNAINHLKHLRHLDYSAKSYDDKHLFYESTVYKLYHLQWLSHSCHSRNGVCHNGIIGVDDICNLVKLRHLHVSDSVFKELTHIRHLTELQELKFYVKKEGDCRLSDLKHLNKLRDLQIVWAEELTTAEEAEEVNLNAKRYLNKLSLSWSDYAEPHHDGSQLNDPEFQEQVLEYLCPHSRIQELLLYGYRGRRVSSWMTPHHLSSIVRIELGRCRKLEHLPPLGQMSSLKHLVIGDMPFVGMDLYGCFPSLETLTIENMGNLEEWNGADNADWFPNLKKLKIKKCDKLKELPSLPLCLKELNLTNVGLTVFPEWKNNNMTREGSPSSSSLLPNQLCKLSLWGLESITSLPSIQVISAFTSLHTIELVSLENLTCLHGLHVLTSLRDLTIWGCSKVVGSAAIHTDDEQVPSSITSSSQPLSTFPHLHRLYIDDVELLKIEPLRRITSAQHLVIDDKKMESLAAGEEWLLQNTTSLTTLLLEGVANLRYLPPTFQSLCSSLQYLDIYCAPVLESLPDMPSSLQTLSIYNCPLLKQRYQKNSGPDWHHISNIKHVYLDHVKL